MKPIITYPPAWENPYSHLPKAFMRVCRVDGLVDVSSYSDERGRVWIDATIAELIVKLNQLDYITHFCCSGLLDDHMNDDDMCTGYISFLDETFHRDYPNLPRGLHWECKSIIRSDSKKNQDTLRAAWGTLKEMIS